MSKPPIELPGTQKPVWVGQTPLCSYDGCPEYDGKRCELEGHRPDSICGPAVRQLVTLHLKAERVVDQAAKWVHAELLASGGAHKSALHGVLTECGFIDQQGNRLPVESTPKRES